MAPAHDKLWESGYDEPVEVNQRALIDKVLARYSAEFTVFRELLQNSDDAKSTAVQIRFETVGNGAQDSAVSAESGQPSKSKLPDLKTAQVQRWVFKNNGEVFTQADWSRLKKIADGNPDEDKIGAFGVGFYSLFSETDEPRVRSGDQWMCFYWKDGQDQLFVRRGKDVEYSPDSPEQWTTFEMPLRDPGPIPVPFDFARFLASSITFMTRLSEISVYIDDYRLIKLTKNSDVPKSIPLPPTLNAVSPNSYMKALGLNAKPVEIKAELMRAVYTSGTEKPPPPSSAEAVTKQATNLFNLGRTLFKGWGSSNAQTPTRETPAIVPVVETPDPTKVYETSVQLDIYSVDVAVKLDKKLSVELQRATKKDAPAKMKYELIYTGKNQYDASQKEDEQLKFSTGSVFQALRADLDRTGSARIFIGHATAQTTGIGGNMSARFIPTVEREQLDLSNKYVGDWNKELLHIGGLLSRAAFEVEMGYVKDLWSAAGEGTVSGPSPELRAQLTARAHHILKFFTFRETTPQQEVRASLERAFFRCSLKRFPIISTVGVRDASEVIMPDPAFAGFLKETPFLPESLIPRPGENSMINTLRQGPGWLKDIQPETVIQELAKRPLNEEEMIACLKWWVGFVKNTTPAQDVDVTGLRPRLLEAAILNTGPPEEKIVPLVLIKRFLITKGITAHIPLDGPLPDDLLPITISQKFRSDELKNALRWQELTIVTWLTYIVDSKVTKSNPAHDITLSPHWAERVFTIVARAWSSLSRSETELIISLLKDRPCIPTSAGMQKPTEAYFATANVFKDLPTVAFPSGAQVKGHLEQVLLAIGVRKHVDIQIVFDRMVKTNEWSAPELAKYFANVRSSLSSEEVDRLRVTPIFTKEMPPESKDASPRYVASQLHEPIEVLREMKLPILNWGPAKWKQSSEEARFLFSLGLRRQPDLNLLVNTLCTSTDSVVRAAAFKYLLDNIELRYKDFDVYKYANVTFVPAVQNGRECLAAPSEVSTDPKWSIMGFKIVQPYIQAEAITKLKLKQHPPVGQLLSLLQKTAPKDVDEARQWFAILAGRISDFSSSQLKTLGSMPIVPIQSTGKEPSRYLSPSQCFFSSTQSMSFHSALFVFVDFGTKANTFLSACGTQREPSVEQLAQKLLEDPLTFYKLTGGPQSYYRELTNIALRRTSLSSTTLTRLKRGNVLLASRRKPQPVSEKEDDLREDEDSREYDLKMPGDIIIADDANAYQLFGDKLWTAPPEEVLEEFYSQLGSRHLSSLVREEVRKGHEVKTGKTQKIRSLVLERLPLFLHEHSHSSRTRISLSWLSSENNFIVKSFGTIQTVKSLSFGNLKEVKTLNASAAAYRNRLNGPVELWIANNDEPDMYEVATSLNRLIFEAPKAHDALLFMTILSTDLRSLSRRGYNVDRILRQQKAQRLAREEQLKRDDAKAKELNGPKPLLSEQHGPTPPIPPKDTKPQITAPSPNDPASTGSAQNILKRFSQKLGYKPPKKDAFLDHEEENQPLIPGGFNPPARPSSMGSSSSQPPSINRSPHVTPLSNIASNVDNAIRACRPESGHLVQNREQMTQVREALNDGYCDISGQVGDLKLVGELEGIKVYLTQNVPAPDTFVQSNGLALARLINWLLLPLAQVYGMPSKSLHVFNDTEGGIIAFNRNGSIFVNFRYYSAWHDAQVEQSNLTPAFISLYFTLAHELAHNLVGPHNAEHEFYFSAICEKFIGGLVGIIHS